MILQCFSLYKSFSYNSNLVKARYMFTINSECKQIDWGDAANFPKWARFHPRRAWEKARARSLLLWMMTFTRRPANNLQHGILQTAMHQLE